MSRLANTSPASYGRPASSALTGSARITAVLRLWSHRRRTRAALAHLDAHLLSDIGIDRLTAEAEAERQFWN
jgi:uncharacterized protein YjiS (DUF1127 family)